MNKHVRNYNLPPACANVKVAEEFGRDLWVAKCDPSDDEECCEFLMDLYPDRLRDVVPNLDRAIYEAGQIAIDRWIQKYGDVEHAVHIEMSRITQDN